MQADLLAAGWKKLRSRFKGTLSHFLSFSQISVTLALYAPNRSLQCRQGKDKPFSHHFSRQAPGHYNTVAKISESR
jgi:hypothetical protein